MITKKHILFFTIYLCFGNTLSHAIDRLAALESMQGLKNPESIVFNQSRNEFYISNVNGDALTQDGNGFIAKISLDGKVNIPQWIKGLHAPKGLGIYNNLLYVADLNALVEIDISQGKILHQYPCPQAKLPNDITIAVDGTVYLSDMLDNSIYIFKSGKLSLLFQNDILTSPNGLWVEGKNLYIATWGKMTDGFKTLIPGTLKKLDISKLVLSDITKPMGNLDGLVMDLKKHFWITDWLSGKLYQVTNHTYKLISEIGQGAADLTLITLDGKDYLLIPKMHENKITVQPISN